MARSSQGLLMIEDEAFGSFFPCKKFRLGAPYSGGVEGWLERAKKVWLER